MTEHEPTPNEIENLLDRYAREHRGEEIDFDRLRAVLENIWDT